MAYATSVGGSVPGYSGFAKLLDWLIALCVITIIPLGIAMDNFHGPLGDPLYNTHTSLGMLILVLMVALLTARRRRSRRWSRGAAPHLTSCTRCFMSCSWCSRSSGVWRT